MKREDDRNWSAHIDGELSVAEVEKFEALLSPDELAHLNNERSLEEGIGGVLKDAPRCPESLMNSVKNKISKKKSAKPVKLVFALTGALAACLAVVFMMPKQGTAGSKVPLAISDLEKESATGDSLDEINQFLEARHISLELRAFTSGHHVKRVIGAGVEKIAGEEVVTLLFSCCGRPAKVYILPKDSKAEELMVDDNKDWKSSIQALVKKGGYRLALSSPHDSESILSFITLRA